MRYAADLHLHSRHASAVSPGMTLENIALQARRKGIDVIGTGDCLQFDWLRELEAHLVPAEPGWFQLVPEIEERITRQLPALLQRPLRWVLSTEVSCATPRAGELNGIHHLIYFLSFEKLRQFRRQVEHHGNLAEGRPPLQLDSRQVLELALATGDDCHMVPAHVMNPYFSCFGSIEGVRSLEEWFGDLVPRLWAVETGLTSTPDMCRRVSPLDRHALYSCSDAHSLENIGRECTILETEPGYGPLFNALAGKTEGVVETVKFPITRTRYYLNRCGKCAQSFEGLKCPQCGRKLIEGSRDRLEKVADRPRPVFSAARPPFRMVLPLKYLLAELCGVSKTSKAISRLFEPLLGKVGHERFILTEASHEALLEATTPQVAEAILTQREPGYSFSPPVRPEDGPGDTQLSFL
jgi:DNA helicase-2/ATP-dependent DNA helicase PcrA